MRNFLLFALAVYFSFLPAARLSAQETRPTAEELPVVQEMQKLEAEVFWYKGFPNSSVKQQLGWVINISRNEDPLPALKLLEKFSPEEFRSLNFSQTPITDEMLEDLPRYKNLHSIKLNGTNCTNASLSKIAKLTNLEQLTLGGSFDDEGLAQLISLAKLESLWILGSDMTDAGMKSISLIQSLQTLSIHKASITDEGVKSLSQLKNLQTLSIFDTTITEEGFAHLSNLENLTSLNLVDTDSTDAGVAHLTDMKKLRSINFRGKEFTDQTVEHLLKLPDLSPIRITESQITPAGIKKLEAKFPKASIYIVGPGSRKQPPRKFPPGYKPPQHIVGTPATVEVPNSTATPAGEDEFNWDRNHALLSGGTVYLPDKEAGAQLKFTVKTGGYVVLAVSWLEEGMLTPEQQKQRKSLGQLLREGWKIGGYRDRRKADGTLDRHFLLAREFKPGTEYEILTRHKTAPILFLPTRTAIQFLGRYQTVTASIEDLEKLPPRFPKAGLANFDKLLVTTQLDPTPALPLDNGLLLGEIARQAIQLTARHEFSLGSMDTSSGLKLPEENSPVNRPLEVVSTALPESLEITVLRAKDEKLQVQWKHWFSMQGNERYELLTKQMEKESRSTLIEELRTLGFSGEPYPILETGEAAAEALQLLPQMNCIAQYAALQYLHEQIQQQGESPERLSALARAYANISQLTEFHFRPLKTVWRARALLYAERLNALYPKSPLAIPTKAYAWALIGRHQTAIALLGEQPLANAKLPAWIRPIAAFCYFEQAELEKLADDPESGELSRLLLLVSTLGYRDEPFLLAAADRVLEKTPDSYYAIHEIGWYPALGPRRQGIALVQQSYLQHLGPRLLSLPYFSQEVHDPGLKLNLLRSMNEIGSVPDQPLILTQVVLSLIEGIRKSAENGTSKLASGTPGNDLLAAMLEDLVFAHLWQQLTAYKYWLGVGVDDELQAIWPQIQEYPLAVALAAFSSNKKTVETAREKAAELLHPEESTSMWGSFRYLLKFEDNPKLKQVMHIYGRRKDTILGELGGSEGSDAVRPTSNYFPSFVRDLQLIAPHMPSTIAWRVETDPDFTVEQGKEFAKKYKDSAPVLYALADRFTFEEKYDLAEQCWKRYIQVSPSASGWRYLASMYLKKGDEDLWLETMEQALKAPTQGLGHASINDTIAGHFMESREFRKALPYALKAADSYSAWGLLTAASCYEGLQDWTNAEALYRAEAERYVYAPVDWYFYCRRTGQGNLAEAYQLAFDYVGRAERGEAEPYYYILGALYLLDKQYEKGLFVYQQQARLEPCPFNWLLVANAADLLGDEAQQRAALQQAIDMQEEYAKKVPQYPQTECVLLAKIFLTALNTDATEAAPAGLDLQATEKEMENFSAYHKYLAHYLLGNYFLQRDQEELCIEHFLKCMETPFIRKYFRTVAGSKLLELGITPEDYREALQTPIEKPKPEEAAAAQEPAEEQEPVMP